MATRRRTHAHVTACDGSARTSSEPEGRTRTAAIRSPGAAAGLRASASLLVLPLLLFNRWQYRPGVRRGRRHCVNFHARLRNPETDHFAFSEILIGLVLAV